MFDFFFLLLISYILENTNLKKIISFLRLFIYFYFYIIFCFFFNRMLRFLLDQHPALPEESVFFEVHAFYLIFFIPLVWSLKSLKVLNAILWFLIFYYYYDTIFPVLFSLNETFGTLSILSFLLLAVLKIITFEKNVIN